MCYNKYENEIWNAFRTMAVILLTSPCFGLFLNLCLKEPKSLRCVKNYGHIYCLLFLLFTINLFGYELLQTSLSKP